MKNPRALTLLLYLVSVILFSGCGLSPTEKNSKTHIIDVTGVAMALNYSKSSYNFGPFSEDEDYTLSLAVHEGDLLYFMFQDLEFILFYRYNPDDGTTLSLSFDSTNQVCYLNDEIVALYLFEESNAWKWIQQQEVESFRKIKSLYISLPVQDGGYESLERIARINPDPGLHLSGNGPADELFNLFSPEWIFAEDISFETVSDRAVSNLSGTELLVYSCADSGNLDFLHDLPGLQSLILDNCSSNTLAEFPLERLGMLKSLCLIGSDIHDLSCIESLTGLQNIDLVECENLETIRILEGFSGLKGLGFYESSNIQDIGIINEIPGLERLCMPSGITQADFAAIIAGQPSLKVIELLYCENITDLSPLENNSGLMALTISIDSVDLSQLYGMKNLELLILEEDYFEDSLQMDVLKRALPDTRIVPGGTFCLGSGWLILLIPMIIMLIALKRWKEAGS